MGWELASRWMDSSDRKKVDPRAAKLITKL